MKKVTDCQSSQLDFIYARIHKINTLQAMVQPLLPVNLQPFCRVANYEQGYLVLAVATPAWATRLRFELPNLKIALKQKGIDNIRFYVEPAFETLFNKT